MTLSLTLNTDTNLANGERTITTQDAEESSQSEGGGGGGARKAHKPECTG